VTGGGSTKYRIPPPSPIVLQLATLPIREAKMAMMIALSVRMTARTSVRMRSFQTKLARLD
jgi:hypothetical protein